MTATPTDPAFSAGFTTSGNASRAARMPAAAASTDVAATQSGLGTAYLPNSSAMLPLLRTASARSTS
ncbi:hypothetical protein RB201_28585 [Streptomyces sp. S1A(2023)]